MTCLSSHRRCVTVLTYESKAASFPNWALGRGAHCVLSWALKTGPGTVPDPGRGGRLPDPEQSVLPFICSETWFLH